MPVMLALATSYAAYQAYCQKQLKDDKDDDNEMVHNSHNDDDNSNTQQQLLLPSSRRILRHNDIIDPTIDLHGKTFIELLPFEKNLSLLETSISTITYYDGNYKDIVSTLQKRVFDIVYRNPWLGGWIVLQRRPSVEAGGQGDGEIQLMYDPSSDDLANQDQLFQCYDNTNDDGERIEISRDSTPYKDLMSILLKRQTTSTSTTSILVPTSYELLNQPNQSLWRVSVIPDCHTPDTKFALVVSMSHVLGDARTFYQIYQMLINTTNSTTVQELNPIRHLTFMAELEQFMGTQETYYVQNCISNPKWLSSISSSSSTTPKTTKLSTSSTSSSSATTSSNIKEEESLQGRIFYVSMDWIQQRKLECSILRNNKSQTHEEQQRSSSLSSQTALTSSIIPVLHSRNAVSSNSIICSWFFNILKTKVGLMTVNFIQDGIHYSNKDDGDQTKIQQAFKFNKKEQAKLPTSNLVGNYINTIPYTSKDYELPEYIEKSLETGKRLSYYDTNTKLYLAEPTTTTSTTATSSDDTSNNMNDKNDKQKDDKVERRGTHNSEDDTDTDRAATTTFAIATNWSKWSWVDLDLPCHASHNTFEKKKDNDGPSASNNCHTEKDWTAEATTTTNKTRTTSKDNDDDNDGSGNGIKQVLHLPLYDGQLLKSTLLTKMAFINVFTATCGSSTTGRNNKTTDGQGAKQQRRLGAYILAPKAVMKQIDSSGIIDEIIDHF